ncbi:MAG TPA: hypothetical protein PLG34_04160 [Spirochaetota bacterium]|nr:MAG: hypothetical protein BWX91_00549 [Spirochaetes bacterium ADurb.Bin133]HPY87157.1 hypothetical protein [Spirochaetota bacterium]
MKAKLALISIAILFIISVFNINAKVSYEKGADGAWYAIVTNSSYKDIAQLNIIGTFIKWEKPGVPMTRNAEGNWEARIKMDTPKVIYKFYNPAIEGDAAYWDDPENDDKTANPFGSFDWVLRRPKGDPSAASGGTTSGKVAGPCDTIWYEKGDDGAWYAVVTNKTYKDVAQLNIIGTFIKWEKPGVPMTRNAEGNWEARIKMDTPKVIYKFFNPAVEGDAAYWDDTANPDKTANPFGSFDWVLRRPKADAAATADAAEEDDEEYNPRVGLWSRTYYFNTIKSDLTYKIQKDDDGAIDAEKSGLKNSDDYLKANNTRIWLNAGESVSTLSDDQKTPYRVWYGGATFYTSATIKVHGKMAKNFVVDLEWNVQNKWSWEYDKYWEGTSHAAREAFLTKAAQEGASKGFEIFFATAKSTYHDQLAFSFEYPDIDARIGIFGCKYFKSKDPMKLVVGDTVGDKDIDARNLEFYIHPTVVPGLDINVGFGSTSKKDKKWMIYANANYNVLKQGKYNIGLVQYLSSYSPEAVSMFNNGVYVTSLYGVLKPIDGLTVTAQYAIQYHTRFMNTFYKDGVLYHVREDDDNGEKGVLAKGYDFFANSAIYLKAEYVKTNFFKIGYAFIGAGAQFNGGMSKDSPITTYKNDDFNSGFATPNETNYHMSGNAVGNMRNVIDFSINPIRETPALLTVMYGHELSIFDLYSPAMDAPYLKADTTSKDEYAKHKEKFRILNVFKPAIQSKFKAGKAEMKVDLGFDLSLMVKHDNDINRGWGTEDASAKPDSEIGRTYQTGAFFTFDRAFVSLEVSGISDVLKKVNLDYTLKFVYYDGYWETSTAKYDAKYMNMIQWRKFINQLLVSMKFKHDISLDAGFVFRYYHGEPSDKWTFNSLANKEMQKAYNAVPEYFNWGLAFGLTYVIPVRSILEPQLFANICLGWDPFDIGDASTGIKSDRREDGSGLDEQSSYVTIGIKWDF